MLLAAQGQKINTTLEEYLAVIFKEETPSSFDDSVDAKLEAYAQKQLEKMKAEQNGR